MLVGPDRVGLEPTTYGLKERPKPVGKVCDPLFRGRLVTLADPAGQRFSLLYATNVPLTLEAALILLTSDISPLGLALGSVEGSIEATPTGRGSAADKLPQRCDRVP